MISVEKQRKRSRKKHLSKEAIRKIVFKQTMYRHTRKDEDYANYYANNKEAFNLATTEIRKSKRTFEKNSQVI